MSNNLRLKILQYLQTYKGYTSGQLLAEQCGVSRTAIWKHVTVLRRLGYQIESVTNKGYRLTSEDDYNPLAVTKLTMGDIGKNIKHLIEVDSTNRIAKEGARQGEPHGTIYLADRQSGGRGRRGRLWQSPLGGLWLSIVLRPTKMPPYQVPLLTMLSAVALCEAVREVTGVKADIKWPNDLLVDGKKIAGILTEMGAEQEVVKFCVVGIGLNANFVQEQLPQELQQTATTLQTLVGGPVNRQGLLLTLCNLYSSWYETATRGKWQSVLDRWQDLNCTLGKEVKIVSAHGDGVIFGQAIGVDEYGALIVKQNKGNLRRVLAGDVSIRSL